MCNIPLLDVPLQILKKYENDPYCNKKGVLLPVVSNQKMNAHLKELADICGIDKQLTTHTGRHSFTTSVALANGVSIENVAKMIGHSDTKMTRHYARVLDKSIMRDMAVVNSKFSDPTDQPTLATSIISASSVPIIPAASPAPTAPASFQIHAFISTPKDADRVS